MHGCILKMGENLTPRVTIWPYVVFSCLTLIF